MAAINYPDETLTPALLIGGGLITIANVILQLRPPIKPLSPQPAAVGLP